MLNPNGLKTQKNYLLGCYSLQMLTLSDKLLVAADYMASHP
jgi:hypothetical protein